MGRISMVIASSTRSPVPTPPPQSARGPQRCLHGPRVALLLVLALVLWLAVTAPLVTAQRSATTTTTTTTKSARRSTKGPRPASRRPQSMMMRGLRALDEGELARATLTGWEATTTLCFADNATLRVRLDPLNSTLQPYLVRHFGQSPEAQVVHELATTALGYVQDYAGPLRSFFWAWSDLRVMLRGIDAPQLRYSFHRSPGAVCNGLLYAAESAASLHEWVPPVVVSGFQTLLHGIATIFCENCSTRGCELECLPIAGDPNACMLLISPSHAPCVTIASPAKPFLATAEPVFSFSLTFYTVLSSFYVQNFLLGLVLFYSATRLSRSRTFHYVLGATIGITFSALLALYFFSRQTKSATRMIPGMQLLQSLGTMVSFVVPFTGYVVMPWLYHALSWGLGYLGRFWAADEVLGIPHLGKLYFLFFGLTGLFLVWWNQWGATPKGEQEEQSAEEIEEIGYLGEDFPMTTSQAALGRLLQVFGLLLLFHSTSSTEMSLMVIMLALLTGFFELVASTAFYWYHYEAPGQHTTLISKKEYEVQAKTETEKALRALQEYLKQNPDELERVKEENEIRLRRFAKGRDHMDVSARDPTAHINPKRASWLRFGSGDGWSCTVQ